MYKEKIQFKTLQALLQYIVLCVNISKYSIMEQIFVSISIFNDISQLSLITSNLVLLHAAITLE
jgi:hypothetical protein